MFNLSTVLLADIQWTFGNIVIAVIVIAGIIGIALVACRVAGIVIPNWVWQILGIVAVVVIAVIAIKFLLSL